MLIREDIFVYHASLIYSIAMDTGIAHQILCRHKKIVAMERDCYLERLYEHCVKMFCSDPNLSKQSASQSLSTLREYIWDLLHAKHWKDVDPSLRKLYSCVTLVLVCILDTCTHKGQTSDSDHEFIRSLIHIADKGNA